MISIILYTLFTFIPCLNLHYSLKRVNYYSYKSIQLDHSNVVNKSFSPRRKKLLRLHRKKNRRTPFAYYQKRTYNPDLFYQKKVIPLAAVNLTAFAFESVQDNILAAFVSVLLRTTITFILYGSLAITFTEWINKRVGDVPFLSKVLANVFVTIFATKLVSEDYLKAGVFAYLYSPIKSLVMLLQLVLLSSYIYLKLQQHFIQLPKLLPTTEEKERLFKKMELLKKQVFYERSHPEGRINKFMNEFIFRAKKDKTCGACLEKKTLRRVIKLSECGHIMCYKCLKQYILTCADDAEGTALECPYEPAVCPSISTKAFNKVITSLDPSINEEMVKAKVNAAQLRKGLLDLHHVMHCPIPDCVNVRFSDTPLVEETFIDPVQLKRKLKILKQRELWLKGDAKLVPDVVKGKWGKVNGVWLELTNMEAKAEELRKKLTPLKMKIFRTSEKGVDLRKFKCSNCEYHSCVLCKKMWTYGTAEHTQMTCEDFHEAAMLDAKDPEQAMTDKQLQENIKKGIMRKCPKCAIIIEKNLGCKHMTCRQCKYQFCWTCNSKWGQCRNCS